MTLGNKLAVRILLLVAKMFADDANKKEIEQLSSHIAYAKES